MKERPIIFSAPMVRAILAGHKTMTRRVVKLNASGRLQFGKRQWHIDDPDSVLACPYGIAGDRLWVRETFQWFTDDGEILYRANPADEFAMKELRFDECPEAKWRPAIHMPRAASRINLQVTAVRIERLQDISQADAIAEGIARHVDGYSWQFDGGKHPAAGPEGSFAELWEYINGDGSWDANPWVWVVSFKRLEAAA